MKDNFILFVEKKLNEFSEIYFGGLNLHDKSYIKKLNTQTQKFNIDINFKFTTKERKTIIDKIKGNVVFNYDVQAELILIHNRCKENGIYLTLFYDKRNLNGSIYLFIQKEIEHFSKETDEYICCTLNDLDTALLSNIFIYSLAFDLFRLQRNIFSGYYSMNYDQVDKKIILKEFSEKDFIQTLSKKVEQFLTEGSWFQILDKDVSGNIYLRISSNEGKRTYSTLWLNNSDIKYLTLYIPEAIKRLPQENILYVIRLVLYTEQKRGETEFLVIPVQQLLELINKI